MKFPLLSALLSVAILSGCASYRTDSNVNLGTPAKEVAGKEVQIMQGVPDKPYQVVGPVQVSVKKLTVFHKDPTIEQANQALKDAAKAMGVDAVIKVVYESGIGFTTWGYMDAKGEGIRFTP